ncbi:hypothetical protein [Rhizobium sp. SGZ-381]|uniref:hypothetical protein n=1 Tax=Rhizobium sp. SGZ-381 TaxID=3342800 RepID=UPI00366D83BD
MKEQKYWLFMVPWMSGSLLNVLPADYFGSWTIPCVLAIACGAGWLFNFMLERYWTPRR